MTLQGQEVKMSRSANSYLDLEALRHLSFLTNAWNKQINN